MTGSTVQTREPQTNPTPNRAKPSATPQRSSTPQRNSSSGTARRNDTSNISRESRQPERSNPINFGAWSPAKAPASGENLRRGMDSTQVKDMQQALKSKGMDLEVDGKFGPETQQAVREYQRKNKLQVDGVVGPETSGHLNAKAAAPDTGAKPPVANAKPPVGEAKPPAAGAKPPVGEAKPAPASPNVGSKPAQTSAPTHKKGDAFTFSSNPQNPAQVKQQIERNKQNGQKTMVGIDPHNGPAEQQRLFKTAKAAGAETHKYLEGRGGPTGDNGWEKSEWARTKAAAANLKNPIHLTSQSDNSPGMKEWNNRGGQEHSIKQAREAKKEGYDSIEVDNINRLDSGDNTKRTLDFYRQYASEFAKGDMPTLLMKNQSADELKSIHRGIQNFEKTKNMSPEELAKQPESVRNHRLPREMFSDFAITEIKKGQKLPAEAESLANALGIRMLPSTNTYQYDANGRY